MICQCFIFISDRQILVHIVLYFVSGRFWISTRKMVDFDVNVEEWDSETGMPLAPNTQLKQMW